MNSSDPFDIDILDLNYRRFVSLDSLLEDPDGDDLPLHLRYRGDTEDEAFFNDVMRMVP